MPATVIYTGFEVLPDEVTWPRLGPIMERVELYFKDKCVEVTLAAFRKQYIPPQSIFLLDHLSSGSSHFVGFSTCATTAHLWSKLSRSRISASAQELDTSLA